MTPLESGLKAITEHCADLLIAAKCRGLLRGYHARWNTSDLITAQVEDVVESDLWNPGTGAKSRSFRVMGKIDWRGTRGNRQVMMDHKTCSEDIADPSAPYWRQLIVEGQLSHYLLLEWLNGRKIDEAVWDVARRPAISPRKLSKAELSVLPRYAGMPFSAAECNEAFEQGRETYRMYEARLAEDCTHGRPDWYFQRRTIPRMDAEIFEYAGELWEHGQEMLHARRLERYARNSGACMLYGSPCKYLGICSDHDTADSQNWRRKEQVHTELPVVVGDGRNVLTNSRVRCFQTCRRKHYYDYELGIERIDQEEKEALYFGHIWHVGLEAYFNTQKEQHSHGYSNIDAPAIAVGTATEAFTF